MSRKTTTCASIGYFARLSVCKDYTACADFPTGIAHHPRGGYAMVLSVVACCVWPSYSARPSTHRQSAVFSFFCPWWAWSLTLTFKLGWDFCTTYLITKFDGPTFSRLEVIMRTNILTLTNKQTPLKTSTSLRYAMLVGKKNLKNTSNCGIGDV